MSFVFTEQEGRIRLLRADSREGELDLEKKADRCKEGLLFLDRRRGGGYQAFPLSQEKEVETISARLPKE